MFIDARTLVHSEEINAGVCIVGGGAAGISLARELSLSGVSVCVLESGGFEPDSRTQALCRGESEGIALDLDESRLRRFGGSTNHWTGWCRPLDPIDFEARSWLPHSGWPFAKDHLDPFYDRAGDVCEIGPLASDAADWEARGRPLTFTNGLSGAAMFQFSPPTFFGQVYRAELAAAASVRVVLNANVVEILASENGATISRLVVRTLEGKRLFATASVYVLAAGGIENARLLLASTAVHTRGIGNGHDLVGRFFMEHPYFFSGKLEPSGLTPSLALYAIPFSNTPRNHAPAVGAFTFTERLQRREELVACAVRLFTVPAFVVRDEFHTRGVQAARRLLDHAREGRMPPELRKNLESVARGAWDIGVISAQRLAESVRPSPQLVFRAAVEPAPNPNSRVTLSHCRDALGEPQANLDWRLGESERKSADRMHELLTGALARDYACDVTLYPTAAETGWPASFSTGGHHCGTTRMHRSPSMGVVDENCRVHDVQNLFVAGSSVFPTVGYANPTLTIVALALRLADHIGRVVRHH